MNKQILAMATLLALGGLTANAQVTIDGNETEYASLYSAVQAAESGATINVNKDYTDRGVSGQNSIIYLNSAKNITINGGGHTVSYNGLYVISMSDVNSSLDLQDITFKNTGTTANGRNTFSLAKGSVSLKNVTIDGANVSSANGIIYVNSSSNLTNAVFDNVKLVNCITTAAPAQVVLNNNGNVTLKGGTELTLKLGGSSVIKDASAFTGNVGLVLDAQTVGTVLVKNCTTPSYFSLIGQDGNTLLVDNGNLELAAMPDILNATQGLGYTATQISNAISAAKSGSTLVLNTDLTLTSDLRINGKTLTFKGATGEEKIIRGQTGNEGYIARVNNANDNVTFENLVIDGDGKDYTMPLFIPMKGAKLTLRNVKVTGSKTSSNNGLIVNDNSNPGTWHLDGVTFENCTVPNQEVVANAEGNTISGDNSFTLRVNSHKVDDETVPYAIDAEGVNNSNPIQTTMQNVASLSHWTPVFLNCSSDNQFECTDQGYSFLMHNNGKDLYFNKDTMTGIGSIAADGADAPVEWYNLMGEKVSPIAPGIYIRRQGATTEKVLVR